MLSHVPGQTDAMQGDRLGACSTNKALGPKLASNQQDAPVGQKNSLVLGCCKQNVSQQDWEVILPLHSALVSSTVRSEGKEETLLLPKETNMELGSSQRSSVTAQVPVRYQETNVNLQVVESGTGLGESLGDSRRPYGQGFEQPD